MSIASELMDMYSENIFRVDKGLVARIAIKEVGAGTHPNSLVETPSLPWRRGLAAGTCSHGCLDNRVSKETGVEF